MEKDWVLDWNTLPFGLHHLHLLIYFGNDVGWEADEIHIRRIDFLDGLQGASITTAELNALRGIHDFKGAVGEVDGARRANTASTDDDVPLFEIRRGGEALVPLLKLLHLLDELLHILLVNDVVGTHHARHCGAVGTADGTLHQFIGTLTDTDAEAIEGIVALASLVCADLRLTMIVPVILGGLGESSGLG